MADPLVGARLCSNRLFSGREPPFEFVALDTETGGRLGRPLISLGIAAAVDGRVISVFASTIRTEGSARLSYSNLHGLTREDLVNAPAFDDVWYKIAPLLLLAPFVVAHNAAFERRALRVALEAMGQPLPPMRFACTLHMARRRWPGQPAGLSAVCHRLQIPRGAPHVAIDDAAAAARVFLALRSTTADNPRIPSMCAPPTCSHARGRAGSRW